MFPNIKNSVLFVVVVVVVAIVSVVSLFFRFSAILTGPSNETRSELSKLLPKPAFQTRRSSEKGIKQLV